MLFWLLGHAAKNVPAIQAAGVTLVVDDADQSPVPVSQVLVILLEFIVNVLPVRISKVLVVSKHVPRFPWFQKAVAAVSPNPGLLRRFGIDIVHVNRQTLLDYVDEVNLPVELGGKLDYNHSEWFKDLAPVFANLTYAAPQLPPSKHHPEVTINKAIAAEENDPSILTEFLADSWSTANHTLRRIQTASATVAAATTSASTLGSNIPQNSSAEATAAYIAILEDYRDRHNRHFATFKRPMDEKEALTAHSDALNDAKSRFGQEKNGLELLESIENDLNTMENDASQTFSERLRNSLMQQVMEAKRRWEFLISSRTLTTEDELNAQVTDVLAEIKPENAPKGLWESVVTAMDEYVRKPLLPVIEDEAAKDKVKGKERLGA
ncbi:hypothetical protein BDR26DRAFT_853011 [Obelidium mucronatum]|nr:hypothetical protein BDR26DRAFT_853011 [Obelidium mucronatum]